MKEKTEAGLPSGAGAQPAPSRRRGGFRPDIEGLRAVAVLAVVLYHAGVPGVSGGFVGVDVFFVVSGYLITGLLWRELTGSGRISMLGFYGRRSRRLLPAAVLVVVATGLAARAWMPPTVVPAVMKDGLASAFYVGNYRFALQQTDYLHASAPPSPYQHFWSLGVEEQFYMVWPLLLLLAGVLAVGAGRGLHFRPVADASRRRACALSVLGALTVGSFLCSLWLTHADQPWAFFSLPTRAWELGAGGVVALASPLVSRVPPRVAAIVAWISLAGVVSSVLMITPKMPFPGWAAVGPVAATAALLGAGEVLHGTGAAGGAGPVVVLGRRPVRYVGRISYSLYLWHWPMLTLAPYALGHPLTLYQALLVAALSTVVASGSYRWVEAPARHSKWLTRRPGRGLVTGLSLSAAGALVCVAVASTGPALASAGPATAAPLSPPTPTGAPAEIAATLNSLTKQVQGQLARASSATAIPSNLTPSVANAINDQTPIFTDGCMDTFQDSTVRDCSFGDPASPTKVVLFGDSHAASWFPAIDQAATAHNWDLITLTKAICVPLFGLREFNYVLDRWFSECGTWRHNAFQRIAAEHPALVILGLSRAYQPVYRFTPYGGPWLSSLSRTIVALRSLGAKVLVIGPVPKQPGVVPDCLSTHVSDVTACDVPPRAGIDAAGKAAEERVAAKAGAEYLDVQPWFCTQTSCPVIVGNISVWRDDNHITQTWSRYLAPLMSACLQQQLPTHTGTAPRSFAAGRRAG